MGVPSICEMSGCQNVPLVSYAGSWLCGECMSKWNNQQNMEIKRRMEEAICGS